MLEERLKRLGYLFVIVCVLGPSLSTGLGFMLGWM